MNILIDPLPASVEIGGREYAIDTDFSTSIRFELLMSSKECSDSEKIALALNLYYPNIPEDAKAAFEKVLWFYSGGAEPKSAGRKSGRGAQQVFDYEYDAPYIYAAFMSDYGIDLQEGLHWWRFRALFQALKEDNQICKIMGYRTMDVSQLKGKEKNFYAKMKQKFAIPLPKSEQEQLDEINEILLHGGDLSKLMR